MGLQAKKILGIDVTISPKHEILEEIRKYLGKPTTHNPQPTTQKALPFVIFTPNPEIFTYAQKDSVFRQVVNTAQITLPDGAGVVWAIKKIYHQQIERISGSDLMLDLCNLANKEGFIVGLIGGRGGVALEAKECLLRSLPKLKIELFDGPEVVLEKKYIGVSIKYIGNEKNHALNTEGKQDDKTEEYFQNLTKEIVEKKIDIFFVALGHPKQEYFINQLVSSWLSVHSERTNQLTTNLLVLMAVGGSFDYISGRISRAPKWVRDRGFEWLYRLVKEPWRLSRQLKGAEFFYNVMLNSFQHLRRS